MYTGYCFIEPLDTYIYLICDCQDIHTHEHMHRILSDCWQTLFLHPKYRAKKSRTLWIIHPSCLPLDLDLMSTRIRKILKNPPAKVGICTWGYLLLDTESALEIIRPAITLLELYGIPARADTNPQQLLSWIAV